ncbi:MAG: nucleotidyltransferase family protein [Magnetococcales bacterium]|nr:nucleotidyltransferase family protein [Magnetococcales bacterium]
MNPGPAAIALLTRVFREPTLYPALPVAQRDRVLRLARRARVLGSLAVRLEEAGCAPVLSTRERDHLEGAVMQAQEHHRMLHWEVDRIGRALAELPGPRVLLKGAAYALAEIPIHRGRLVADVDILVAESQLPAVEEALKAQGWVDVVPDPYDQRYYRDWMHEIPPLRHRHRLTEVDVHHAILPRTSRLRPATDRLLAASLPLPGSGWRVLDPHDMTLHAITHLFYDSDFERGFRDLLDLDGLLRHCGPRPGFWAGLVHRSRELELGRPLYYALRYLEGLLGTPIPPAVVQDAAAAAPPWIVRTAMDRLVPTVLQVTDPDRPPPMAWLAWTLLYLRSHWLRMPPGLLLRHLLKKSRRRWLPSDESCRQV